MNWLDPIFMDFRIFLQVPLPIKVVLPKQTWIWVHLIVPSAIRAFEGIRARFAFFSFKARWVCLFIGFTIPTEFTVVLWFVMTITLDTLWFLNPTRECWMSPSLAIFALEDFWVSVSFSNCCNVLSNIEASIDEVFGSCTTLSIPDINPDDCHI